MARFYPSLPSYGMTLASISIQAGHATTSEHLPLQSELQYFSKPGKEKHIKNQNKAIMPKPCGNTTRI